jgi:hypothetical protein
MNCYLGETFHLHMYLYKFYVFQIEQIYSYTHINIVCFNFPNSVESGCFQHEIIFRILFISKWKLYCHKCYCSKANQQVSLQASNELLIRWDIELLHFFNFLNSVVSGCFWHKRNFRIFFISKWKLYRHKCYCRKANQQESLQA